MGKALNNDKLDGKGKEVGRINTHQGPCEMKLDVARMVIFMLKESIATHPHLSDTCPLLDLALLDQSIYSKPSVLNGLVKPDNEDIRISDWIVSVGGIEHTTCLRL